MSPPTPYYLIDERRLQHNLELVERVRDGSGAKSLLALKCFSTWGVFDLMRGALDGTTSSSYYEARLGYEEFGTADSPREVHAYSVAWDAEEIAAVAEFADKVIVNSIGQLEAAAPVVGDVPLGLRINPGVSHSHFELADPARPHSRLGVTDDDALRDVTSRLAGVMFHFNCENADFEALSRSVDHIAARFAWLLEDVDWVSLGGGIAFTSDGYPLDAFVVLLRRFAERFGVQVYLEPGEAVISGCAELVTTVLDVVRNEVDIAIVDASLEAHMLDHLIYRTHPRIAAPPAGDHAMTIAGRTCLAGDVFGTHLLAEPLRVGDEVRFADAAGYTMVKTTWFNGLRMPAIALARRDGTVDVLRQFGYDDFKRSLS